MAFVAPYLILGWRWSNPGALESWLYDKIQPVRKRLTLLEAQQQWVYRVLETYGIKGLWLSPGKASALLGISRNRILAEVERAEKMRSLGKCGNVNYGIHYRNIQDPEVGQPTWQIHVAALNQVLAILPSSGKFSCLGDDGFIDFEV